MKRCKELFSKLPLLVVIVIGLTPVIWFWGRSGMLINGNDTNFPLAPVTWFLKRFYIWNDGVSGGVGSPTMPAGLFFHGLQVFFFLLSRSLHVTELLSFIFWFMAIALSFYFFLRLVFGNIKPIAAIVGVTFYSFNIYLFNTWENAKVANLALVVGLPALLGLFISGLRDKMHKRNLSLLVIIGFVCAGAGINPAYFWVILLALLVYLGYVLAQDLNHRKYGDALKKLVSTLKFLGALLVVNLFWIIPLVHSLFLSSGQLVSSLSEFGLVNWLTALSQNTSVLNVLRLIGAWDWYSFDGDLPLYIPYALNYFNKPFYIFFSLLIPFLVFTSIMLVRKRRRLVLFFALLFVSGVLLGVGVYGNVGKIYLWLSQNIPFFSFFRSPWYVFTPLVTLSTATLLFMLFEERLRVKIRRFWRYSTYLFALSLIIGNLFYTSPQITGEIFRPNQRDNTFMLAVPDYVLDTRDWLAEIDDVSRVVTFPNTAIERFTWGYSGLDSILQLVSDQDVIYPVFGTNKEDVKDVLQARLHQSIEEMKTHDMVALSGLFAAERFFVKHDGLLPIGSQVKFKPDFSYFDDQKTKIFGQWDFYGLKDEFVWPRIYAAESISLVFGDQDSVADAKVSSDLGQRAYIYEPHIKSEILSKAGVSERIIQVKNANLENFKAEIQFTEGISEENTRHKRKYFGRSRFNSREATYNLKLDWPGRYEVLLEDDQLENYGFDLNEAWQAILDGKEISLKPASHQNGWVKFEPLELGVGEHRIVIPLPDNPNLISDGSFEEDEWLGGPGVKLSEDSVDGQYSLELFTTTEQITLIKPIDRFDPKSIYLLSVDYKREYGPRPMIIIAQRFGEHTPRAQKELMSLSHEWAFYETLFTPAEVESYAEIRIIAGGNLEEGTRHRYDKLSVTRVFSNKMLLRHVNPEPVAGLPKLTFDKVSPTRYQVHVEGAHRPYLLVFSESFDPGWQLTLPGSNLTENNHLVANGYANAWLINETGSYDLSIKFTPQRFFFGSLVVSLMGVMIAVLIWLKDILTN